jgi:heptaprenylglyceryl phosphate synthase
VGLMVLVMDHQPSTVSRHHSAVTTQRPVVAIKMHEQISKSSEQYLEAVAVVYTPSPPWTVAKQLCSLSFFSGGGTT